MGFVDEINALIDQIKEAEILASEDICKEMKERYEEIIRRGVQMFYADYSPHTYRRTFSLYDVFDVSVRPDGEGGTYTSVEINEDNMTSSYGSLSGSALLDITYRRGWHGGAPTGPAHPLPGVPMTRAPIPFFTEWYEPAAIMSEPPEQIIVRALTEFDEYEATLLVAEILDRYLGFA